MKRPALVWGEGGPVIRTTNRDEDSTMTREQAIDALNAEYAAGDITPDQYELERSAIDYAHSEAMSALERWEVVA